MGRYNNYFEQTESIEINGTDVKIDGGLTCFYVSDRNDVFCYTGILLMTIGM